MICDIVSERENIILDVTHIQIYMGCWAKSSTFMYMSIERQILMIIICIVIINYLLTSPPSFMDHHTFMLSVWDEVFHDSE